MTQPDQVDRFMSMYDQYEYMMFMLPHLTRAKVVVETGLGGGHSTNIWLASLSRMTSPETRHLYTFENDDDPRVIDMIEGRHYAARWTVLNQDSRAAEAATLLKRHVNKIDVLYLDAGHDRYEVDAELANFAPMLAETGVLLTHDSYSAPPDGMQTHNNEQYPRGYIGPTETYKALKNWADCNGWKTLLLTHPLGMTICYRD